MKHSNLNKLIQAVKVSSCLLAIASSAAAQEGKTANYRISPNDSLDIKVFQEDDLNASPRVNEDGTIVLPLVGSVRVGNQTTDQAIAKIEAAYKDGYLVSPKVTLTVQEYSKRSCTLLGQVQKAGALTFPDNRQLTLVEVIGLAGGYTRIADPGKITVRRGEQTIKVNAKKVVNGIDATTFKIEPGDVIQVGESLF